MPTPKRRQPVAVIARLLAEPHRFDFFQAVRLLDRWIGKRERGRSAAGLSKRLYFRNTLSLGFPASEIAELKVVEAGAEVKADEAIAPAEILTAPAALDDVIDATATAIAAASGRAQDESLAERVARIERIEITPAFVGLLGAGGALPIFYTELLAERETYHRDTAARAFLDIFQHRAVSLFYEAWRKHRLPVQYETDRRNKFLPLVLAVAGVGQNALRDRLHGDEGGVADDTLAYFSGLLQQRPVSAAVVQQIVSEYFKVPVVVDQFIGRWFTLPPGSATSLGMANAQLDASAVVGERVWQRDLRMRLTIGPMLRAKFHRFLPGGSAALALRELLTMLTGVTLEYEVRLSLRAEEVQGTQLDAMGAGAHLGWDSFLVTRPEVRDRFDAGYDIHALA
jgi:type VI secretion system protein ImpH